MPTTDPADEMYKKRYFEIAELLDEVLGTDEDVRTGEGIVQDVRLLDQLRQHSAQRADATRQMANEANARLRSLLLAALGIEDDGKTSLTGYAEALVADRDAACQRGRTAAAEDPLAAEVVAAAEKWRDRWRVVSVPLPERGTVSADLIAAVDAYRAAARVAENGTDPQWPVERTADVALDCGGCGDTIWPTERIYEFGDGRVRCTICQVKSSSRGADQ